MIGGGTAGLSCTIRAAELNLNVLVIEARSGVATGGNMLVDSYPGFYSISRQELLDRMIQQAKYNAKILHGEEVTKLDITGDIKRVYTKRLKGDYFSEEFQYKGRTVVLATGLRPGFIGIPGEKKFHGIGKGIYHYPPTEKIENKNIVIIGNNSWAVRNALYYDSEGCKVHLISQRSKLTTHPALERKLHKSFVKILLNHQIEFFQGKEKLSKIVLKDPEGTSLSIPVDIAITLSRKSSNRELYLEAGLSMNAHGTLIVSASQETNIEGVLAAGSATRSDSIVGVAASEGIKAAEVINRYILKKKQQEKEEKGNMEAKRELLPRFIEGKSVIVEKEDISPEIIRWVVRAPQVAKKYQAGQFVVLRIHKKGERIPLTISSADKERGTISLIFQKVGKTTKEMGLLNSGDHILNLLGPLGQPLVIKEKGNIVVLGGGCGVAPVLPKAKALKEEPGNHVISIISARTSPLLICRSDMREASHELHIATDDGSEGHHGFGLDILKKMVEEGRKIDHVLAVGPIPMMKFTCLYTKKHNIPTTVSLAPLMVDGTGMCGACRVKVGDEIKFACVDGPCFDGLKVDFEELALRSRGYLYEERISVERAEH